MKIHPFAFSMLLFNLLIFTENTPAQDNPAKSIYIIFDASGSMWQKLPDDVFKIEAAKQVLGDFVTGDFQGCELAFRAYGHRQKNDCRDSELIVPFNSPENVITPIKDFMATVNPTGKTPISYSLREALKDFGNRSGEIILISDGEETCDEDPCALIREWRDKDIKINVHVVGFGLDEKTKTALQCISEAAGTVYHDANSASELAAGLSEIQVQAVSAVFILKGVDKEDRDMKVSGILSRSGKTLFPVESHKRNAVESGEYELTAGVKTANGNLYKPVKQPVQIAETGETVAQVLVETPPSVKTSFTDQGEEKRGSLIYAYQNGKEVFSFRWVDEVFVDEGMYEFRAKPNAENELSVTETFAAGDHKTIEFKMAHIVHVLVKMVASGSGAWFRQNYELWQNGEKKYDVHLSNGVNALPGVYDLHLPHKLFTYEHKALVITEEDKQSFEIAVPVGYVTFIYQTADGSRDKDKRCFVGSGPAKDGVYHNSGEKYPLLPGAYNVTGWQGEYDRVVFEVKEGEEQEIVLRAKK